MTIYTDILIHFNLNPSNRQIDLDDMPVIHLILVDIQLYTSTTNVVTNLQHHDEVCNLQTSKTHKTIP